jgi:branched-chain amino acid transport system ATP-binding protein
MSAAASAPLLEVDRLDAAYGAIRALRGVSLTVARGEVVALLGANGAGKTSLMRAIAGVGPSVTGGLRLHGRDLAGVTPEQRVRSGIALVPEGRHLFGSMTIEDNLLVGRVGALGRGARGARGGGSGEAGTGRGARGRTAELLRELRELFPVLRERSGRLAGSLSGGQQQQVAIARALMSEPELLLLDEPSLGLSPQVVDVVFETIAALRERGMTMLLVEQDVAEALAIADRCHVLASGQITRSGTPEEIGDHEQLVSAYFGSESES